jgi:serine protease Do
MMAQKRKHMQKIFITALFMTLTLYAGLTWADEGSESRVFPIPRYEAEQVVTDWLKHEGYKVSKTTGEESVLVKATRNSQTLRVVLKHHSPLSTEISIDKAAATGHAGALWKYLAGYMQGYAFTREDPASLGNLQNKPSLEDVSKNKVPAPVLNRTDAVVCIKASGKDNPAQLTGYIVDKDGLIICTAHTLQKPQVLTIYLSSGLTMEGKILRIDKRKDLALIDCSHQFSDVISFNNSKAMTEIGQRVFSIGYPLDHGNKILTGFISGTPRLVEGQPLLQARMVVEPGSSGSPVFDAQGNLVAMVKGRLKGDNLSGLLIPLETIISFIKEK